MEVQEAIEKMRYRISTASEIVGNGKDGKAFEDMEMAIQALKMQQKMKEHCEGSCTMRPYYNPTYGDMCMNDFIIDTE